MYPATITQISVCVGTLPSGRPSAQAAYQNGGWIRSMPWSRMSPKRVDLTVTRASLPSTVSRKVISQAHTRPGSHQPSQKARPAAMVSARPVSVTWLGVMPRRAQKPVAARAGTGHHHLVMKSVTPL